MNLTKDEARILAEGLEVAKFEWTSLPEGAFNKLTQLQERLTEFGKDQRRKGRTTQDTWADLLKRYVKPNKTK